MQRYHGLDFLRAAMMLMGIILHVGLIYMPFPNGNDAAAIMADFKNPYRDIESFSMLSQRLVLFIHFFRMPAFMLLAGFFAALVTSRRGSLNFFGNRLKRIVLPAILFWFILWPLDSYSWTLGQSVMMDTNETKSVVEHATSNLSVSHIPFMEDVTLHTMHLWFLYYLIMFYGFTMCLLFVVRKIRPDLPARTIQVRDFALTSRWKYGLLPMLILLSWVTLKVSSDWHFLACFRFEPSLITFAQHYVFFAVGWLFYGADGVLRHLKHRAWTYTALGLINSVLLTWNFEEYASYYMASSLDAAETLRMDFFLGVTQVLQASCVWLMIFGFVGLSERYITKSTGWCTYLVGASYWLYLVHRPFCTGIAALLEQTSWSGGVKTAFVSIVVAAICLVSYHFLVRNTWVGVMLNGRRARDLSKGSATAEPSNTPNPSSA
ncbi:MAG: acyltransferase family protein [Planctomycetota bacterium]|nr:acyltransferase family protein [Planctomycetota bacterium]